MTPTNESQTTRPRVTIVTSVFNEQACLPLYEKAVTEILFAQTEYDIEVLFVDDGSSDRSWSMIQEMARANPRFRGIRLSRNFGAHVADSAGISHASGDAVAVLPADLQDPPAVVLEFLKRWRAGAKIVWGRRRTRADASWRVWTSNMFFGMLRKFAMPRGSKFCTGGFFLLDRAAADCFRQFQEHHRITFALVAWTGFDQDVVEYDRKERVAAKSHFNLARMLKSMYDAFVGFSTLPIRAMTLAGLFLSLLTFLFAVQVFVNWLTGDPVMGWTSLALLVSLCFSIQFLLMGIVGEYLYRIYAEAVRRPLYFISDKTSDETSLPPGERGRSTRHSDAEVSVTEIT